MCAAQAGYRGRSVLVLDNAKKPGRKILISGGGRCNFTNHQAGPHAFLSANPHFCKSALARYTQQDFIDLVDRHGLSYHEKTLGQLFCDESAKEIVDILLTECDWAGVALQFQTEILTVSKSDEGFVLTTSQGRSAATRWWWPPAASPCRNSAPPPTASSWRSSSASPCCRPAPDWCPSPCIRPRKRPSPIWPGSACRSR
ncbi:NAD(P)/FAD-dependent oxidoreductase [Aeromonas hydrophila]|uniref:NAD(P)/FAD-dependent oxidoreductase n=1 Tax=Aeromonas hydrophila TaxID=644 RepID=UPI003F78E4AF